MRQQELSLLPPDSRTQKQAPRVRTGARPPRPPGTEAPWLHLVHELLHLLHGVVGLQGESEDPHLLLLFLRHWARLLFFSLQGKDKQKPVPGAISRLCYFRSEVTRHPDSSLCAQPLLPESHS